MVLLLAHRRIRVVTPARTFRRRSKFTQPHCCAGPRAADTSVQFGALRPLQRGQAGSGHVVDRSLHLQRNGLTYRGVGVLSSRAGGGVAGAGRELACVAALCGRACHVLHLRAAARESQP
eukprot:238678-Rhodomonas_salina.1